MSDALSRLLEKMRPALAERLTELPPPWPRYTLFLSLSDGQRRASVVHASGADFDALWQQLCERLGQRVERRGLQPCWLRADWVTCAQPLNWRLLKGSLTAFKRNYFRYGLALDEQFNQAFLEGELNANAMLYGGARISHAVLNQRNFKLYAGRRFPNQRLDLSDEAPVVLLSTEGLFCDLDSDPVALHPTGRDAGRRVVDCDADIVRGMIERGARYLAREVREDGRFNYGWHPCFDRPINAYNTLRHASTLYAMLEAWEVCREPELAAAIERGLDYLCTRLIRRVSLPDGSQAAFLIDVGDEIKLGGNAVCLLALVKYSELFDTRQYLPLLEALALGIRHMQHPETGEFVHVLNYPSLEVKQAFRIIYYDGEAAFGLMWLYSLTRDERWLAMVEKAFDSFIAREHWKAHDHWLGYCVNELTRYRPEERYFRFGIRNVADHLDFVIERITTFPTLLELMMAARRMLDRIQQSPEHRHLLGEIDLEKFDRALHTRAAYLMNDHFWPEYAMYFRNPARILGSFFIRHHAFRVRIDDVEHYLSGYVAYHAHLLASRERASAPAVSTTPEYTEGPNWTADRVLAATGGRWLQSEPGATWRATGLSTWAPSLQGGQMVAVRSEQGATGVPVKALAKLPFVPQALITDRPEGLPGCQLPVLQVDDLGEAVLAMGRYARRQLRGRLIGVTGSAGKTSTVAMLSHALRPWGEIGQTRHNANLPHGIAWNLASIPWDAAYTVLELAIGRMAQNSQLARPDVALVTNIAPAHLEFHGTTEQVARRKSRIFEGMQPGAVAVLNRDMQHWEVVHAHALSQGLRVVHFGSHADSQVRLIDYCADDRQVAIEVAGQQHSYLLGAAGRHMAYNSLACIAVALALELPLGPMLAQFELFQPVAGRGAVADLSLPGLSLRVIDEAYNANPLSMHAALELLGQSAAPRTGGRRVAILGDMLELGKEAQAHHLALAQPLLAARPDLVLLCGIQMQALAKQLEEQVRVNWFADVEQLNSRLLALLEDGDLLLVKSSGGTGLSRAVEMLRQTAQG